jgi:hypothetical protein
VTTFEPVVIAARSFDSAYRAWNVFVRPSIACTRSGDQRSMKLPTLNDCVIA